MNAFLYRSTPSNSYATFFYAQIDERNRRMNYVNAGHNPPFLVRSTGEALMLPGGGPPLGIVPLAPYARESVTMNPGDVLAIVE